MGKGAERETKVEGSWTTRRQAGRRMHSCTLTVQPVRQATAGCRVHSGPRPRQASNLLSAELAETKKKPVASVTSKPVDKPKAIKKSIKRL